jgi:uncharacterized protein (DUF427 family)
MDFLGETDGRSQCPYKGIARYFTATIGGEIYEDIAWSYDQPVLECPKIKDLISFYNENVDAIIVDDKELKKPITKWSK